ncbi:hypothetical protein JCGZ_14442 [Jatropha curcas]|uniref:MYB family protein n=1 Tax=Jatropha curcas TaxID=180498 RepID=A0A067JXH6_JATCU|nr:transcription factor MYB3R-3 [Jatropha curcas]AIT52221.1 MYB family protein [Jatropha curcas]KDP28671.1 hypothetical protein JCGZ_14442 [Jatropha curcas]
MGEEVEQANSDSNNGGLISSHASVVANPDSIPAQGRITGPTRRSTKGGWTEKEDQVLVAAVKKFNCRNWKKIAECVPDRTDVQCLHRWQKVLNPDLVKGPWKKEEDDLIRELVGKQGNKKWSEIAKQLPGRIGKQCRERWHNHLNPEIKRTAWTKEEELTLIKAHAVYGNKWAEIAKFLHGRTENSIKNHWNCSVRKKVGSHLACDFNLYSSNTKSESRKFEADDQRFDERMNLEGSMHNCSLALALGNATTMDSQFPITSDKGNYCKFQGKEPTFGASAASSLTSVNYRESQNNANTTDSDYTNRIATNWTSRLCYTNNSSGNLAMFQSSCERTCELSDTVNSLHSGPLSVPLTLSLSTPISVAGHDRKAGEFNDKITAARGYENTKEPNRGLLCYESLQLRDLDILVETGSFPSTDSYIKTATSPFSSSTPLKHNRGISHNCSSPEFILKSAAKSFRSTPSIIRKRSFRNSGQSSNAILGFNDVWLPEDSTETSCNSHLSLNLCPYEKDCDSNMNPSNERQLFLSSAKSQKLETQSEEKSLDFAFNGERDSTSITSRASSSHNSCSGN